MSDQPGYVRRFGRYEVLDKIGGGTMGVVYRARDPVINRIVAVKSISLAGHSEEAQVEYRERFMREAEAAGRLSHPGIVTVFDVGEEPETHTPYMVMEYVKGSSLEHSGRLTARVAVALAREIADALECAHAEGVVHRDLKPANILLTEDGHAKIADFGVAKLNLSELTTTGQVLGTPAFMSPEQLNGDPVDGRSDIFSLGVILYTLLTGHRPFQGNSIITVSFKVVHHEPVPPEAFNLTLPPGLNEIVCRAMAKDPAKRYRSAKKMALDLESLLQDPDLWEVNKEPESAPTGLLELTDRVYAKHAGLGTPGGTWFDQKLQQLKNFGAPAFKARGARWIALALVAGAVGAYGIWENWQNSRPRIEAAPASTTISAPAAPDSIRSNLVASAPNKGAAPVRRAVRPPHPAIEKMAATSEVPVRAAAVERSATRTVPLRISVNPKVLGATMTVWVDRQRVVEKQLEAGSKMKGGLFGHGAAEQTETIYVAPGEHQLRVSVQSSADGYDESHGLRGAFPEGSQRVLSVSFSSDNQMKVRLK
jgi:serine/threonine-protein kinase